MIRIATGGSRTGATIETDTMGGSCTGATIWNADATGNTDATGRVPPVVGNADATVHADATGRVPPVGALGGPRTDATIETDTMGGPRPVATHAARLWRFQSESME